MLLRYVLILLTLHVGLMSADDQSSPANKPEREKPLSAAEAEPYLAAIKSSPMYVIARALSSKEAVVALTEACKKLGLQTSIRQTSYYEATAGWNSLLQGFDLFSEQTEATSSFEYQSDPPFYLESNLDHTEFIINQGGRFLHLSPEASRQLVFETVQIELLPPLLAQIDYAVENQTLPQVIRQLCGMAEAGYVIRNDAITDNRVTANLRGETILFCLERCAYSCGWTVEYTAKNTKEQLSQRRIIPDRLIEKLRTDITGKSSATLDDKAILGAALDLLRDSAVQIKQERWSIWLTAIHPPKAP
jgi:hypothetical protein